MPADAVQLSCPKSLLDRLHLQAKSKRSLAELAADLLSSAVLSCRSFHQVHGGSSFRFIRLPVCSQELLSSNDYVSLPAVLRWVMLCLQTAPRKYTRTVSFETASSPPSEERLDGSNLQDARAPLRPAEASEPLQNL